MSEQTTSKVEIERDLKHEITLLAATEGRDFSSQVLTLIREALTTRKARK